MKVSIIGAGNVGAMAASRIIDANLADVVLLDIVPGLAKGKALDISDARFIFGSKANISGTDNFQDIKQSDIVVITAGLARKPGMSRDDLLKKNAEILKGVCKNIKAECPDAIVIVVTNPLDIMTYFVMKNTGFNPKKVIGMAGVLDTSRLLNVVSQDKPDINQEDLFVMGSHGDTMVPINRRDEIKKEFFIAYADRARNRGAEIVKCLGSGSAYFAPSAAVFFMLKAIINNKKTKMYASAYLSGEYKQNDIYIGVPVVLGSSGVSEVIETALTEEETNLFNKSAEDIRDNIKKIQQL